MSATEGHQLITERIPAHVKFSMSFDELKIFHRWLYAAAYIQPSGFGNILLVVILTHAYIKVNGIVSQHKEENEFTLSVEAALAFHNLVKASPVSDDMYEYSVISNIYNTIDNTIRESL